MAGFRSAHPVTAIRRALRVAVIKPSGARYQTSFYACSGCSVMFLNDSPFNGWHTVAGDVALPEIMSPLRKPRG